MPQSRKPAAGVRHHDGIRTSQFARRPCAWTGANADVTGETGPPIASGRPRRGDRWLRHRAGVLRPDSRSRPRTTAVGFSPWPAMRRDRTLARRPAGPVGSRRLAFFRSPAKAAITLGTPTRPPRLARRLQHAWWYRAGAGDPGQRLADPLVFRAAGRLPTKCIAVVGTAGWRGVVSPFGDDLK